MVSTVALAAISESTLSSMQTLSVKGYESGHHRLYSSCGMPKGAQRRKDYVYAECAPYDLPEISNIKSDTAKLKR